MKNSIAGVCKIVSIVHFNTTEIDEEFIFNSIELLCNSSHVLFTKKSGL
ncbi:conserved hypothetical protein [Leptospira interrogans serovar Manilae]|uniref:Uncharacterized protein n=1 Tax=Leptospira interrogans serovar Manilae TaxID=214675 RepID=A0AAQ1SQI0_LEPIR|nr:conserved hypothetical protein [Leptospira interrogans serovar Manilae]